MAPARDAATAIAAINHGADAVYMGAPAFGARAAAGNSVEDIAMVVKAAEPFGVKVYVTLNTIIYEHELQAAAELVKQLYEAGVDALIVQDMALLKMDIPPIELHASTQADGRTPEKIANLAAAGFSQIVVPREFSLEEIRAAAKAANGTPLEVFVHGALCVSYSGDCQAGFAISGRSANRGECPQICRMEFKLTDAQGREIEPSDGGGATRHWLSLADMRRIDRLGELAMAGASSFKIEGRLKSVGYVKNVTAAYSQALNEFIKTAPSDFRRASFGSVSYNFTPDPALSFNRGFTRYFLEEGDRRGLQSWRSPKSIGREIGKMKARRGNAIEVDTKLELHNGDGLGWFDLDGKFKGFRVNRAEGNMVYAAPGAEIPSKIGTVLYRNSDAVREAQMARNDTAKRVIDVNFTLRHLADGRIAIDASDVRGMSVTICSDEAYNDEARSAQADARRNTMARLGDTVYRMNDIDDRLGNLFVAASALTALRRKAVEALDRAWHIARRRNLRKASTLAKDSLANVTTTYHDNVANSQAKAFYEEHGAKVAAMAAEVKRPVGEMRVMTTRYCLRRELGACLKTAEATQLPKGDLYLSTPAAKLRVEFDCARCGMNIYLKNH